MSEPVRIVLVGASGMIGRAVMQVCVGRGDVRLAALVRREVTVPKGAQMEMFVTEIEKWEEVIEALRPTVVISALGTTFQCPFIVIEIDEG